MADEKLTNRWLMVAAALVMQLCLGVLYSYSVFRGPLMKEVGFTVKEAGYPYMASLFFFAVGMIFAGRWQDKAGPKKVAIFGGLLLGAGALLAGVLYKTVGGLVFSYGVLGGLGVGFAYVTPIATCIKWFPDMRGTITGLAVFGFGAGTLVFGPLISKIVISSGIANAFYVVGVDHARGRLRRGRPVQGPARRVQAGRLEPAGGGGRDRHEARLDSQRDDRERAVLRPLDHLLLRRGGGPDDHRAGGSDRRGSGEADTAVAAAGLGTMALLNGLGRLVHGSISDKIGRKNTVILMFVEYLVAFLILLPNSDTFTKWLVGICIVGFSYGGYLALMPSITADYFGTKSLGHNYGYLFTAWGVAGVGGPFMIDAIKTATGAVTNAMYYISVACVVGIVLVFISKKPEFKGA